MDKKFSLSIPRISSFCQLLDESSASFFFHYFGIIFPSLCVRFYLLDRLLLLLRCSRIHTAIFNIAVIVTTFSPHSWPFSLSLSIHFFLFFFCHHLYLMVLTPPPFPPIRSYYSMSIFSFASFVFFRLMKLLNRHHYPTCPVTRSLVYSPVNRSPDTSSI